MHCTYMSDVCMLKSIVDLNLRLDIQTYMNLICAWQAKLYCRLFFDNHNYVKLEMETRIFIQK